MLDVNFKLVKYFLLLLLVGCSTVKINQHTELPQSQSKFKSLIQPIAKGYYLVWSNSNPYRVNFEVDSKTNAEWHLYVVGMHNPLSETNVQIYPTNYSELFRIGFH